MMWRSLSLLAAKESAVEPVDKIFVILDPDDGAINLDQGLLMVLFCQRRCGAGARSGKVFNCRDVVRFPS